ncbi:MAG: hypothetical protein WBO68_07720 [Pyrinomonadaceae bacterium]|nr:hypothetical protein [Acidobacteriota bacterium]
MVEIRRAIESDKPAIWQIIKAVIAGGDTYVFSPDSTEDEMMAFWCTPDKHNYIAVTRVGGSPRCSSDRPVHAAAYECQVQIFQFVCHR